jgi:ketosteroid isomerase-like protein
MRMSRQEIELLRHVYDDWAQGDFHSGRDLLHEDIEFRMGGLYRERARGRDVFEQQLFEFLGTWTDYSIEAEQFVDAGDKVLVECHQHGHGKAGGAEVDQTLFTVWTFRNPRVVGLEFFSDEAKARNAAGLV